MKALYICGSINQTKMMHKISKHLGQFDAFFTPYYCDGLAKCLQNLGLFEFTVMGGQFLKRTLQYLNANKLNTDVEGNGGPYDLILTCSDLMVPKNILDSKLVLVQEGMTDPEGILFHIVTKLGLPIGFASTSTTGLSDAYDIFCVASDGYKELFVRKGVKASKIRVTGIPNFDHCKTYLENDFPYKDYVLAATSDRREIYRYENRKKFIDRANKIADGRQLIFKFHPNEKMQRARREVEQYSPDALIFEEGNAEHMVANCCALLTRYSSLAFVGLALGKEVYSDYPLDLLKRLLPVQNGSRSALNIANECLELVGGYSPLQPA